jgi:thiol:disulfide interchange protein/DsbC/DsbD-like thiol-disulfide interchange protein
MQAVRWLVGMGVCCLASWVWAAPNKTEVRLVLSAQSARSGETILAGLQMRMAPRWHTYWVNPGEAGKGTEIQWTLPEGVTAGSILWPVPEKYNWSGLFNYIYHDQAVLLVPLTLAPDLKPGPVEIKALVSWLECEEQCVPGEARVAATLTIGPDSRPSTNRELIEEAKEKLPPPFPNDSARAWWETPPQGAKRPVIIAWNKAAAGSKFDFYPYDSDTFLVEPATLTMMGEPGQVRLRKIIEKLQGDWPSHLGGLLIEQGEDGKIVGAFEVRLAVAAAAGGAVDFSTPAGTAAGEGPTGPLDAGPAIMIEPVSLLGMLGLAFLGGLILNIMPCVLPVIALKILAFVNQSKDAPARVRKLGLIYAVGVLASFLVLAGLVIGVKRAGGQASWGMQFGNTQFLVVITVLVTLVALNLFGVFEVNLGGRTIAAAGTLASREGASGAFFNGVLATALATPCTAPFLSVALGVAFRQPPAVIILVFLTIGLGLAVPYVILSWEPAWLRFLPRPGPWMQRFKVAMGFPMLATAIWLFSILTRHYGKDGILWVGLFLVLVALSMWTWGEFVQRGSKNKGLAGALTWLLLIGGYLYVMEGQLNWRAPTRPVQGDSVQTEPGGIAWQPWSREAVARARAQGRPVFVDFTADWCLTCKANNKTSIEIPSVQSKLRQINALPLLADNTLVRDDIGKELEKYGRAGVPLVLVYPKNPNKPPLVLPTVLRPSIVLDALDKAAQ